jgi:SAM-dependent methyltransferase
MNSMERFYPESRFGGYTDIDGTAVFFGRVNALLQPSFTVLDIGCGRGSYGEDLVPYRRNLRILKGKAARLIGIDVDPAAAENPYLDEFRLIQGDTWPVEGDSVDLIVCDNVVEHVERPEAFFAEIRRVLKDGGLVCIRTPNRWNYVSLAATLIPNKYHSRVVGYVQKGRRAEDVFPTVYRCNTVRRLRSTLRQLGCDCVVYAYEAEPSYLSFSSAAYFLGTLHQRLAPGFLKPVLFAFGRISKAAG